MSIPIDQEVDLLVKKLAGVAKTDTAVNKSVSNESIASPMLNRGDTSWTQSGSIPVISAATANLITAYQNSNAVQCTADTTTVPVGGIYPTWLTNRTNWVPPEFGAGYSAQAYVGPAGAANIVATGTLISSAGQAGVGEWFFDYQAGLLNFIGETIPASLTAGNVVYITGYTYVGLTGVTNLPSNSNIGNININATTISSTLAGNLIIFNGASGVTLPHGNSGTRPSTPGAGTTRFNTTTVELETWSGTAWVSGGGGGGGGTSVYTQVITPDGVSDTYTLDAQTTASAILVSLNGVEQIPVTSYTVFEDLITFAETPLTSDIIAIRFITTTTAVAQLTNDYGNTSVTCLNTPAIQFQIGGSNAVIITGQSVLDISSGQGITLPSYTVAQAGNLANVSTGQIIYVSNGDSGAACLAVYSGGAWKRVSFGANISG